ncbi:MAG: rhomboid family intramembrane serine protease [Chitinophagales bacterium]|nr:rhomboid family intramembrane serine protease [Chitinophagales bacterium]
MYGNTSIWQDIKSEFNNSIISRIIIINVVVFLLLNIVNVIIFLSNPDRSISETVTGNMLSWIMLPADTMDLLKRPWTLLTHMFTHYQIFHLLFNMLWLYWFGRIIQEFVGNKKILPLYIYGGLAGAVLLIIAYNIFPGLNPDLPYVKALGASAGVMAIVVAAATLVPDYTVFLFFFGAVRIKFIALFLVILDLVSIPDPNSGGHIAHLGGMLFGYIFIKQLQVGHDWSKPFNNFLDWIANLFTKRKQPRVVYKTETRQPKKSRPADFSGDQQQRVDEILDKIKHSGYDSLSKEEKEFLFKVSRE